MAENEFTEVARQLEEALSGMNEVSNPERRRKMLAEMRRLLAEADRLLSESGEQARQRQP
jgi:hypothetical protein